MKANLIRESVFTLEVNGVKFPGMRVESRWEGLTKLVDAEGLALIVHGEKGENAFDTLFSGIFLNAAETKQAGVIVVMGSPVLLAQMRVPVAGVQET